MDDSEALEGLPACLVVLAMTGVACMVIIGGLLALYWILELLFQTRK